jgi:hypothetical protein
MVIYQMCEHDNTAFIEGKKCCTDCGTYLDQCVYVTSHARAFSFRRQPIYSRQKRFYHYLLNNTHTNVQEAMEDIMLLFSRIEFFWNLRPRRKRKYFFNRSVTLFFILTYLNIPTKMQTLKDNERVAAQCTNIAEILRNSFH